MIQRSARLALGLLLAAAATTPAIAQYQNSAASPSAASNKAVEVDNDHPDQNQNQAKSAQQSGIQASQKAAKALMELQTAVNAKDAASIPAKVAAAQAVVSTKDDRYILARLQLTAAVNEKNNAAALAAIDAIAATGVLDQPSVAKLYNGIGGSFYMAQQYDQAIAALNKAYALSPSDYDTLDLIGQSQFAAGRKADAAATFQREIQARTAAGQKVDENTYRKAVQFAYDAKSPNAMVIAREWLAAYPNADSWRNTIAIYRNQNPADAEWTLDLLRLMQAVGAIKTPQEYAQFIAADAEQLNFNEAQEVLDAGLAAKAIDPTTPEFKEIISVLKTKPKATAADLQAAIKMSPTGTNLLRIGDRYYGMGDYAKAAEIYRQTMGKAGVDPSLANLHLGMALARAGDKAGATAALNAVTGANAEVAKLWLVYVQQHA